MIIHLLNILKMVLGTALIFLAVILWSTCKKFSSAFLSITAILFYAIITLNLLEVYNIIDKYWVFKYKNIPILKYILPLITIVSFIVTIVVFMKEEKNNK